MKNKSHTTEEKNGKKLYIILVAAFIISFISLSFAFFQTIYKTGDIYTLTGNAKNNKANVELISQSSGINLTNTFPLTDTEGRATTPYAFAVKNNGTTTAKYDLILEIKSDSTLSNSLVRTYFNNTTKTLTEYTSTTAETDGYTTAYILVSNKSLAGNAQDNYNLYTWILETATIDNAANKTWESKVRMVATTN